MWIEVYNGRNEIVTYEFQNNNIEMEVVLTRIEINTRGEYIYTFLGGNNYFYADFKYSPHIIPIINGFYYFTNLQI